MMPVFFISHGSPMLALATDHPYARSLRRAFAEAPRPKAVLGISAHWQTTGPRVNAAAVPGTLHDVYGFPEALYAVDYPAPGDPDLARRVVGLLDGAWWVDVELGRGLDHGIWSVLRHGLPAADVPVVQLSLPRFAPESLWALGAALRPLREEGVLILASGGLVHNLREVDWAAPEGRAEAWAEAAEAWLLERLEAEDRKALWDHRARWPESLRAAPTTEHLDPLFVAMGAGGGRPRRLHQGWQMGHLSLVSLAWD